MVMEPKGYVRPAEPRPRPVSQSGPNSRGLVTTALVVLDVAILGLMGLAGVGVFAPEAIDLVHWGANYGPLTSGGQWWRLITACFVHGGVIHLGFNMYVLWDLGRMTERVYGPLGYLLLYLVAGIGGSFASVATNPEVVSVGASGAVFGIAGAFVAFLARNRGRIEPSIAANLRRSLVTFIMFNLMIGFAVPGIDQAAHIGGLVTGFVTGAIAAPRVDVGGAARAYWAYPLVVLTGVAFCVLVSFLGVPG